MKPFDLDRALAGDPVVTRDGESVRVMPVLRNHNYYPVVGFVKIGDRERVEVFTVTGKEMEAEDGSLDLFMASTKHEGWVNIYNAPGMKPGNYMVSGWVYDSEADAKKGGSDDRVALVKVEWEE